MQSTHFFTSLGANLYEGFILILIYLIVGALIYQIIHLLHIVDAIYVHWTQINLFQLYPLYALSGLTTRAALGFMLLSYFDVLIQFLSSNQILNYLPALSFTTGAIIIFVWPLFGIHQLLVNEKQRAESEAAHHLEAAINHLYKTLDAGQIESMSAQNSALSGLITTQTAIAKIPTWPWQPDTLRWLLGALLLPTLLWITTRILERIGL